MAFTTMGKTPSTLAEINVTPFVDVVLVLLIIFMTTSSVETTRARLEKNRLLKKEQLVVKKKNLLNQKVPISLPRVNSEAVNMAEETKLVLSLTQDFKIYLGTTKVLSCFSFEKHKKAHKKKKSISNHAYKLCLAALEKKLKNNAKLQKDKELYLRASSDIPYGKVLKIMAFIRKTGITKFGLISNPEPEPKK